jgi:hypothetical protein
MTAAVDRFRLAVSSFILETFLTKPHRSPKIKMGAEVDVYLWQPDRQVEVTTSKDDKPSPLI